MNDSKRAARGTTGDHQTMLVPGQERLHDTLVRAESTVRVVLHGEELGGFICALLLADAIDWGWLTGAEKELARQAYLRRRGT